MWGQVPVYDIVVPWSVCGWQDIYVGMVANL